MTFFTVQEPHRKLEITAINEVQVHPRPIARSRAATMPWEEVATGRPDAAATPRRLDAYQFVFDSHYVKRDPALAGYAAAVLSGWPSLARGRPGPDAADLHRVRLRLERANTSTRPLHELLRSAAESARISPTSRSAACARSGWPRGMSAAIC